MCRQARQKKKKDKKKMKKKTKNPQTPEIITEFASSITRAQNAADKILKELY